MKKTIITGLAIISLLLIGSFVLANDWETGVSYQVGDQVTYEGTTYECIIAHTSQTGWQPTNTPALWNAIQGPNNNWQTQTSYSVGDEVEYNDKSYLCKQPHTSQTGWEPTNTPALWEQNINPTYADELKEYLETMYNETELANWIVQDVDKSVKVITYNVELENKQTGELKNFTWWKVNAG